MSACRSLLRWLTLLCLGSTAVILLYGPHTLTAAGGQARTCGESAHATLARAGTLVADAEMKAAEAVLDAAAIAEPGCVPLTVARLSLHAWIAARAAVVAGGSPESLASSVRTLEDLTAAAAASPYRVQAEYARAVVAAAMAASQDERGELQLQLTQARDLSDRLQGSAYPAEWPLSIDEAEGELWLEVDDYEEACRAYSRWLAGPPRRGARADAARAYVARQCQN